MLETFIEFLQNLVIHYGILGVFASVLLSNASILFPLPGDLIVFTAGALASTKSIFYVFVIGIVAGLAAAIGELTAYFAGVGVDKFLLKKMHGKHYHQAESWLRKHGFWAIVFFALTPLPMDIMGLLCGTLKYNLHQFFTAVLFGKLPRTILLAYAGFAGLQVILNIFHWSL